MTRFADLSLSAPLLSALDEEGYTLSLIHISEPTRH